MGTSKVILLSGIYLVLGFYTVSFTAADEANYTNALTVATGTYNGMTVQTTAVFHQFGGRWKVLRVYSKTV